MRDVFTHLTLAQKVLICGAVFAAPVAVLLYFTLSGFEEQVRFTARELTGARAVEPLCNLAVLYGERRPDLMAADADSLVTQVRKAEPELGTLLPASVDPAAVYAAFPRLAESAKLILDPEVDSYNLADLTLSRLPRIYEMLGRDASAALDTGAREALQHAISAAVAEDARKHPGGSSLSARLPPALAAFQRAAPGPKRLQALSALWHTAAVELGGLLQERRAALRRKEATVLFLTLSTMILALVMLSIVVRSVSIPLGRAARIADKIAAGRLSAATLSLSRPKLQEYRKVEMPGANGHVRDEALRLLNAFDIMAQSLNSLIEKVRFSCSEVDGSTTQMTAALRQVEATVAEQLASTNEVVATSKEIFATVQQLAQDMRVAMGMAAEAANLAGTGLHDLQRINAAMQEGLDGAASIAAILNTISERAANINCILGTVTKIANRTNLLSLNAAIEAEKAGKDAAGFAVIGLEIRRVADQTAVAALDIEKMLGDMQTSVRGCTQSMTEYSDRSRGNSEIVNSITADLGRSIECTRSLEPHFQAIDDGMQAQAEAARQILEAMNQLSTAVGQTRHSLAQFGEVAEHMRATVGVLQTEVARFSVT